MPLHYLWKLFGARSLWPQIFLGYVGRCAGMRVRVEGDAADAQRAVRRQPCQLARHPRARRRRAGGFRRHATMSSDWPVVGWLAGLNDTIFVARDTRSAVHGQADALRAARWPSGRAGRAVSRRARPTAAAAAAVPRQPVRLALPAARRA